MSGSAWQRRSQAARTTDARLVSAARHALSIVLLPGTVVVVVPALIVRTSDAVALGWGLSDGLAVLPVAVGLALIVVGSLLVAWTVALFARIGRGTLAPWAPTTRLVVLGPYRHVRNPMISGVLFLLLGEAALLGSTPLLLWFAVVAAVNAAYLPLVEEPGLVRRFGEDYERYRANVPRWLPRLRPWGPQPPP
jgi:protein-S-isoprenylcysteine O-methyltransferase Ste14